MAVPYPLPFPAANPDDTPLITVQFNEDWLPILLRATEDYYAVEKWDSPPSNLVAVLDQMTAQLMTDVIISPQVYPENAIHFHKNSKVEVGNAIAFVQATAAEFNGYWRQNAAAINDTFYFEVFLRAGTYDITTTYSRATNRGVFGLTAYPGTSRFVQWDMYGTALDNAVHTDSYVIDTDGLIRFYGFVDSKNASSTGYIAAISQFYFRRTGD